MSSPEYEVRDCDLDWLISDYLPADRDPIVYRLACAKYDSEFAKRGQNLSLKKIGEVTRTADGETEEVVALYIDSRQGLCFAEDQVEFKYD